MYQADQEMDIFLDETRVCRRPGGVRYFQVPPFSIDLIFGSQGRLRGARIPCALPTQVGAKSGVSLGKFISLLYEKNAEILFDSSFF